MNVLLALRKGCPLMFDADGRFRERCAYYRMMARNAVHRAALTKNFEQRGQLFNVALGWHALAVQIEESLGVLEREETRSADTAATGPAITGAVPVLPVLHYEIQARDRA